MERNSEHSESLPLSQDDGLYEICEAIRAGEKATKELISHPIVLAKVKSEAIRQCKMNPEMNLDELISDGFTLIWNEVRSCNAIPEEETRRWVETRIVWRMKSHVQRSCRMRYIKKAEKKDEETGEVSIEDSRYEKVIPDSLDRLVNSRHPDSEANKVRRQRDFEEFLIASRLAHKYKLPIKLVVIDGYSIKELAYWYSCSAGNASSILKASLAKFKEYIDSLTEDERESILDLIRDLVR